MTKLHKILILLLFAGFFISASGTSKSVTLPYGAAQCSYFVVSDLAHDITVNFPGKGISLIILRFNDSKIRNQAKVIASYACPDSFNKFQFIVNPNLEQNLDSSAFFNTIPCAKDYQCSFSFRAPPVC